MHTTATLASLKIKQQKYKTFANQIKKHERFKATLKKNGSPSWQTMQQTPTVSSLNILTAGSSGSSVGFGDFEKALSGEAERGLTSLAIEDLPKSLVQAIRRSGLRRTLTGFSAWEGLRRYRQARSI